MSNIFGAIKKDLEQLQIDTSIRGLLQQKEMDRLREELKLNESLWQKIADDKVNEIREERRQTQEGQMNDIELRRQRMNETNRHLREVNGDDVVVLPINTTLRAINKFPAVNTIVNRNINTKNFNILDLICIGDYLVARIKYNGCTTLEGIKILLLTGINEEEFINLKLIDPYFDGNSKEFQLIARFAPTEDGMNMAKMLAKNLMDNKPVVPKIVRKMTLE